MNPFVIGIPGFLISCIAAYVCGEMALKHLNAEQAGEILLRVRRHRIRYVWTAAGLFLVFFAVRLMSAHAANRVAPYTFLVLLAITAWFYRNCWRSVVALRTPVHHRRLYCASLICGGLSLAFLFGACAATSFVPKEWLESHGG
jgi:uncharacterized membrane protein (UPF0136 family)